MKKDIIRYTHKMFIYIIQEYDNFAECYNIVSVHSLPKDTIEECELLNGDYYLGFDEETLVKLKNKESIEALYYNLMPVKVSKFKID